MKSLFAFSLLLMLSLNPLAAQASDPCRERLDVLMGATTYAVLRGVNRSPEALAALRLDQTRLFEEASALAKAHPAEHTYSSARALLLKRNVQLEAAELLDEAVEETLKICLAEGVSSVVIPPPPPAVSCGSQSTPPSVPTDYRGRPRVD